MKELLFKSFSYTYANTPKTCPKVLSNGWLSSVGMKLFLSSIAAETLPYLRELLNKDPKRSKVIFIATAADVYDDKKFVERDRKKLVELGYKVEDYDIKGKEVGKILKKLKDTDVIFVAGGNPFYLLEQARKTGFDQAVKKLYDEEIIYVGSSAGAVILGPSLEPIKSLDDPSKGPNLKSFLGLNLIPFVPLPHFDNKKYRPACEKIIRRYKTKFKFLPIGDRQAVIVEGRGVRLVGNKLYWPVREE